MYKRLLYALSVMLMIGFGASVSAQNVTVSLSLPDVLRPVITDTLLQRFEDEHGVTVAIIDGGNAHNLPSVATNSDSYFDGAEAYARSADVLFVTPQTINAIGTTAGYFLDIAPLIQLDDTLDINDFHPTVRDAYTWDGGIWALPATMNAVVLAYSPELLAINGAQAPQPTWTLNELADNARLNTRTNVNNAITAPGLYAPTHLTPVLLRALSGMNFYDNTTLTLTPRILTDENSALFDTWGMLLAMGAVGVAPSESALGVGGVGSAMRLLTTSTLDPSLFGEDDITLIPTPLSGNFSGVQVTGFAVSGGTAQPELAYALVRYLTEHPTVTNSIIGDYPARESMVDPLNDFPAPFALEQALNGSDFLLMPFITAALEELAQGQSPEIALQNAQVNAETALTAARERRQGTTLVVDALPTTQSTTGDVTLNFGIAINFTPLPTMTQWQDVANTFAQNDPQVNAVTLTQIPPDIPDNEVTTTYDCYFEANVGTALPDLSLLRNLDPFVDIDITWDMSDVIGGAMTLRLLERDGRLWGYPINLKPDILRYHSEIFNENGLASPASGWTYTQFVDALTVLGNGQTDSAPFTPFGDANQSLRMLIAAAGGLLIDYRTTPVTIQFTTPEALNATRNVLDLARSGVIRYVEIDPMMFDRMPIGGGVPALYTDEYGLGGVGILSGTSENIYEPAPFPTGTYTPASYAVSAAFITADSLHPEACYRFITTIANRQELFAEMPAFRSLLNNPELPLVDQTFYTAYEALLAQPDTVVFQTGEQGAFAYHYWLDRAFNAYIINDADLETVLTEAENNALSLQSCLRDGTDFWACVRAIDPDFASIFGQGTG